MPILIQVKHNFNHLNFTKDQNLILKVSYTCHELNFFVKQTRINLKTIVLLLLMMLNCHPIQAEYIVWAIAKSPLHLLKSMMNSDLFNCHHQSALAILKTPVQCKWLKHFDRKSHFIRSEVQKCNKHLVQISSESKHCRYIH